MSENDAPILNRIADGDARALDECIRVHGRAVWGLVRRLIPDAHDAEEAVQDVFASIWEHAGRFDPSRSSESTFVLMLARRRIIDRARKRRLDSVTLVDEPVAPSMADHVDVEDEIAAVRSAMAVLRPIERQVLRSSIYEGLSHSRIAETLDMPLGTVKTHLRRGLTRIRTLLDSPRRSEE